MSNAVLDEARAIAGETMWAYLATTRGDQPVVRPVHPMWEGDVLWIATGPDSPKAKQIRRNPKVALFWHLTEKLQHLTVLGAGEVVTDVGEKLRLWDLFDYDLSAYIPEGPESPAYALLKIVPTFVECWALPEMGAGTPPRRWRA